jgi:hypothetical protein
VRCGVWDVCGLRRQLNVVLAIGFGERVMTLRTAAFRDQEWASIGILMMHYIIVLGDCTNAFFASIPLHVVGEPKWLLAVISANTRDAVFSICLKIFSVNMAFRLYIWIRLEINSETLLNSSNRRWGPQVTSRKLSCIALPSFL